MFRLMHPPYVVHAYGIYISVLATSSNGSVMLTIIAHTFGIYVFNDFIASCSLFHIRSYHFWNLWRLQLHRFVLIVLAFRIYGVYGLMLCAHSSCFRNLWCLQLLRFILIILAFQIYGVHDFTLISCILCKVNIYMCITEISVIDKIAYDL
ncbi:hypothetical protein P8452_70191 [Trifolium repens]|nr:hypothetical protein P8452_70191 [Trifolium repens]